MLHLTDHLTLLDHLLSGGSLSPADLENLMRRHAAEALWLDFKSGKIATEKAQPGRRLRDVLASFANSEGGVVFVGVGQRQKSKRFFADGFQPRDRKQTWREWLANELMHQWPYYDPKPKHGEIIINEGKRSQKVVFWVATPRQDEHIYVNGQLYLRHPDGTHLAPDYLVAELKLGRNRAAELELTPTTPEIHLPLGDYISIDLRLSNTGLAWAHDPRIGIVYLSGEVEPPGRIPTALMQRLQVEGDLRDGALERLGLSSETKRLFQRDPSILEPFGEMRASFTIYRPSASGNWRVSGALFVLTRNGPPRFFQFRLQRMGVVRGYSQDHDRRVEKVRYRLEVERESTPIVRFEEVSEHG